MHDWNFVKRVSAFILLLYVAGEVVPFFIAYILTEEGRNNVFGKWARYLNGHGVFAVLGGDSDFDCIFVC